MKALVIGSSGMIGSTVFRKLSESKDIEVYGCIREQRKMQFFPDSLHQNLFSGIDVLQFDSVVKIFEQLHPSVVINCAGLTKHKLYAEDPLAAVPINTLLPHRLAQLCKLVGARMIHISTDCVFSGQHGNYLETDFADASDVYGRSKLLGEVIYPHTITLRTSTIGHEYETKNGLLEWFLSQHSSCKGFNRAIFSGLPTVVFAEVIRDVVIPRSELSGLFHVASQPIDKFDLLNLIARVYGKHIEIEKDDRLVIDRSLNSNRFFEATHYMAPDWESLINTMHTYQ
jgi:dTDP-4-dehydrorhamnose reductase